MITFYDINQDIQLKPEIAFKTIIKLDPFKVISQNTFAIALYDNYFDLYTSSDTLRFTPEFKVKLEKKQGNELNYKEIIFFTADEEYFELLKQYLSLEPCFKIKPPQDLPREELLKLLQNSSCKNGFLEINAIPNPEIDIVLIQSGEEFNLIDFPDLEKINRILIYDIEKNTCLTGPKPIYSDAKNSVSVQAPKSNIHTKLFELIYDYLEKNVSARIIYEVPLDRNKIFRENSNPDTLNATFQAIKKAINLIKIDKPKHIENIKALISAFYTEHYHELEKLKLVTQLEKFYTEI
jgi:hypothetical protein